MGMENTTIGRSFEIKSLKWQVKVAAYNEINNE
jgi:hypothetical protein